MQDAVTVQCPYCWQLVELLLEVDLSGEFVQDCEVCCQPWLVRVFRADPEAPPDVQVSRAQ